MRVMAGAKARSRLEAEMQGGDRQGGMEEQGTGERGPVGLGDVHQEKRSHSSK